MTVFWASPSSTVKWRKTIGAAAAAPLQGTIATSTNAAIRAALLPSIAILFYRRISAPLYSSWAGNGTFNDRLEIEPLGGGVASDQVKVRDQV
jgi:hypothetical protein